MCVGLGYVLWTREATHARARVCLLYVCLCVFQIRAREVRHRACSLGRILKTPSHPHHPQPQPLSPTTTTTSPPPPLPVTLTSYIITS